MIDMEFEIIKEIKQLVLELRPHTKIELNIMDIRSAKRVIYLIVDEFIGLVKLSDNQLLWMRGYPPACNKIYDIFSSREAVDEIIKDIVSVIDELTNNPGYIRRYQVNL